MGINAERADGTVIAKADGRIDSSNSREFHTELEAVVADSDAALVLDFEDVAYISSAGMRVILLTAKSLQKSGIKLALCSMNDSIREVFKISGFDKIIEIHESQAEALSAVGA
ncbi:MAG: STAS domain-containing protein [Acidimicrobiaceae bacterium]|nr:STAS domain-containing protein [Acidimicrobiaceae bacterium]